MPEASEPIPEGEQGGEAQRNISPGEIPLKEGRRFKTALDQVGFNDMWQFLPGSDGIHIVDRSTLGKNVAEQIRQPFDFQDWRDLAGMAVDTEEAERAAMDPDWLLHVDRSPDKELLAAWKEEIPTAEDFTETAKEIVAGREEGFEDEILVCDRCEGHKQVTTRCSCTIENREVEHDGVKGLEPHQKEPDENCFWCKGEGSHTGDCSGCSGAGAIATYPEYHIRNGETMEETSVKIDVAAMIAGGAKVKVVDKESQFADRSTAQRLYWFQLSDGVKKLLPQIGIRTESCVVDESYQDTSIEEYEEEEELEEDYVAGYRDYTDTMYRRLEDKFYLSHPLERYWWSLQKGMQEDTGRNSREEEAPTPKQLIEIVQHAIARNFVYDPFNVKIRKDSGVAIGENIIALELPSVADGFNHLRKIVEAKGYTLGLWYEAIPTDDNGQYGLAPLVLDQEGTIVASLGTCSDLETTFFTARHRFQKQFIDEA